MTIPPRRLWTMAAMLAGTVSLLVTASSTSAADLTATGLRCEYLENPQGIVAGNPRLSWVVTSGQRDEQQTAFHILVASSELLLQQNQGDLWDSGQVLSRQSVHVEYQGRRLESGMSCFWKVRLWGTKSSESEWSERLGWCDHNLLFRTECYSIDVAPMIAKWMIDVQDSQSLSANGSFLQCAPTWGDQESPGWSDVGITGVCFTYKFYGDRRIIDEHYDSMLVDEHVEIPTGGGTYRYRITDQR